MKFFKALTALGAVAMFAFGTLTASAQDTDSLPARVTDFATSEAPDDHIIGSDNAAITLIIWASVTCPHCGQWFTEEWPIVKSELVETEKLRVVFRPFPTAPAELSMTGFRLAECAPTKDYMSIIEYQMENQKDIFKASQEGRGRELYAKIAKMAGMETDEAIATCFKNPDITTHIIDNANRATLANVKGVPAFLINGETYKGKQDAKSLVELINDMDEKGLSTLPEDKTRKAHDHE